jgi:hypothetical protein
LLYLLIIACGIGSEAFIRQALRVPGDAQATAANILASEALFRLGFMADVVMALSDVALAVLLYVLLAPVSRTAALMATAFRLVQTAIVGNNLLNHHTALRVLNGSDVSFDTFGALSSSQLESLASFALDTHAHGYDLGLFFFGINSVLMGALLYRAEFAPKVLGVVLCLAGGVYLVGSTLRFVAPTVADPFALAYVVPVVAELWFAVWLLKPGAPSKATSFEI